METAFREIIAEIRLRTGGLENEDYAALMRRISGWAEAQAEIAEYKDPCDTETDEQ